DDEAVVLLVLAHPDRLELAAAPQGKPQLGQLLGLELAPRLVRVGDDPFHRDRPRVADGARPGIEAAARRRRRLRLGCRRRPHAQARPHRPTQLVGDPRHQATSLSPVARSRASSSSHSAWMTLAALLLGLNSVIGWPVVTAILRSRDTGTLVSRTSPG